jgi:hypothetical protein
MGDQEVVHALNLDIPQLGGPPAIIVPPRVVLVGLSH